MLKHVATHSRSKWNLALVALVAYSYDTPGNYVNFADNGNGYYVLQATVDDGQQIRETNERDNISYAYIKVTGNRIKLLERGHGRSPWDPDKDVVFDWVKQLKKKAS